MYNALEVGWNGRMTVLDFCMEKILLFAYSNIRIVPE